MQKCSKNCPEWAVARSIFGIHKDLKKIHAMISQVMAQDYKNEVMMDEDDDEQEPSFYKGLQKDHSHNRFFN